MDRLLNSFGNPFNGLRAMSRWVMVILMLLIGAASSVRADIIIKFDDLKDGDKVADVAVVIVRADSGDGIDKVEFAVDDQLRFSTGSSPYTFKWDTITDVEGAHNLAVTATDANGVKKTVKLGLTIDNELTLGAPALATKAREALLAKDYNTAGRFSRRALKAEPNNIDASRALAAILADKLSWDKAISALEKAKNLNSSAPAMLELAGYRMRRAVVPENSANIVSDIEIAGQLRRKAAIITIEATKAKNLPQDLASTHETLGDAYLNAARYAEAIQEYSKSASSGALTSTNRLALAFVLNNQPQEASILLRPVLKDKVGDSSSRAVMGLALLRMRKFASAKDMVRADLGGHSPACQLVAAYADAITGQVGPAAQAAKEAALALPGAGEAHYALSMSLVRLVESEAEVVTAMALSPFQQGPLIDFAVRYIMLTEHSNRYEIGLKLLDVVLKNDPENRAAQLAKVLVLFHLQRMAEAEPIMGELTRRDGQSADVQMAAAVYFDRKGNPTASEERIKQARNLDPEYFALGAVPRPIELLFLDYRKLHYRGGFYLSPESLYPPKGVAITIP